MTDVMTDRERRQKLAEMLERYRHQLTYQRNVDIQWGNWAVEIGLSGTSVISQYRYGTRFPEGMNLVRLARYFMTNFGVDLYAELGIPSGGMDNPRIDFILDCIRDAPEEKIALAMRILGGGAEKENDSNPNFSPA